MVDENPDRSYAPGRQPAPERDIEPLWPAAQTTPPSWSPVPAPGGPGQPPGAGDGTPVPTGWAPHVPSEAARAWAPHPNIDPVGAASETHAALTSQDVVPAPRPAVGVNLHQPFGLDPVGPPVGAPAALTPIGHRPTTGTPAGGEPAGDEAAPAGRGDAPAESPWALPPQRPATNGTRGSQPGTDWEPTDPTTHPGTAAPAGGPESGPAPAQNGRSPEAPAPEAPAPGAWAPHAAAPEPPAPPIAARAVPPTPYPPPPEGPAPGHQPAASVSAALPPAGWTPMPGAPPTAEDFARRRQLRPMDPMATMGVRAVANKMGLRLPPGRLEQELRRDIEMVRRNFGGLRQVTVVNPKGGAGKTVAILLLAMTFGQKRGGYILAWDNNETQGTLGMRAQQDFHARTVRDLLRDLAQFQGSHGRVGDLSQYVRAQGEGMFDVLASDESATGGEMLTAAAFGEIREVVSRFYKLIFVDTGNNVRAQNWQAAMDATDQLVVTMSARNDSAETAARMLDHLEQSGRQRLVRQAVTVVSMPPSRKEMDLPAIEAHFAARTRAVLLAPYERLIDSGEPLRYGALSSAARDAWLKIAAAVAEGL
ncbi:MinD/ParA family ATP-binding protein [Salinispora arenicola]|uniref:MinD/ParA family ATP-binding protein n=1 Tax=Salinispora arenicola TaxID=168697 RepID=UPI000380F880|nr:chromosome partitioning protein [Salinispora arenicola]